ncbi:hypothetical protein SAMN05216226_103138 [Halovenus aranensis]|jgi:hypothetical protein|uniref:Uncharacterized protein n=1 Tax=Halovenus aranensis TaxID=890420 RepID=A0A1G8TLS2_9EURY|nr:hypothetical protein [Halovenus aranensis]SDJ42403.1 hypothetical protein SAMN05216226_103138 [Halovenus aranensis]
MQGYILLERMGYVLVYALTAVALAASAVTTFLGVFSFGALIWWPTFALLLVVLLLEVHRYLTLN